MKKIFFIKVCFVCRRNCHSWIAVKYGFRGATGTGDGIMCSFLYCKYATNNIMYWHVSKNTFLHPTATTEILLATPRSQLYKNIVTQHHTWEFWLERDIPIPPVNVEFIKRKEKKKIQSRFFVSLPLPSTEYIQV